MKPQDIIVLIKLHLWKKGRWTIASLADSIFLSHAETHAAIKRLTLSFLFDAALERPKKAEMEEFFCYGLRYCFPAELGPNMRGIPTAHSATPLSEHIIFSKNEIYIWPHPSGEARGFSVKPLYKTAPDAALADPKMYQYLALIDCLRIGKAREQKLAKEELIKLIQMGNQYDS